MKFENPYRHGAYNATVAALLAMGMNRPHKFSAFTEKFKKVWSKADAEGYRTFANKPARNEATAKDLDGRILQNCRVLQRTKDYGKPLLKAGAVIDLTRDDNGSLMIALNTRSKKPLKPGRAAKAKPETKPAKSKAKATRKPTGGKKRAQKRSVKAGEPKPIASVSGEASKPLTDGPSEAN